jgi:hypothetical protein
MRKEQKTALAIILPPFRANAASPLSSCSFDAGNGLPDIVRNDHPQLRLD